MLNVSLVALSIIKGFDRLFVRYVFASWFHIFALIDKQCLEINGSSLHATVVANIVCLSLDAGHLMYSRFIIALSLKIAYTIG